MPLRAFLPRAVGVMWVGLALWSFGPSDDIGDLFDSGYPSPGVDARPDRGGSTSMDGRSTNDARADATVDGTSVGKGETDAAPSDDASDGSTTAPDAADESDLSDGGGTASASSTGNG